MEVFENYLDALEKLQSSTSSPQTKLKAGSFLIQNSHYDYFPVVLGILEQLENEFSTNIEWHYCMGFGKATQHDPEGAVGHLLKTLAAIQNNPAIYTALSWAYLQVEDWAQSFLTCSAGLNNCEHKSGLQGLAYLSKVRLQGHQAVAFNKNGTDYKFALFTSNTQEIEASLHHLSQKFTEIDELEMIQKQFGEVGSIAEIGCLVGNHSVYFLKNLNPSKMLIIDASETSLKHAKQNIELNLSDSNAPELSFLHSAVGLKQGEIEFFEQKVPVNPIDSLLSDSFDFLKIDVDGMEIEVLNGAKNYIKTHRPKIMIEVLHVLKDEFQRFLSEIDYEIFDQVDHQDYSNYLIRTKA